jgi:hypothetical protein
MKKSLQKIEDYYIRKGFSGDKLRQALETDKEYQKILAERKRKLVKKFKIAPREKQRYVLSTDKDYEILGKIYRLEKLKLSPEDRRLIEFIRTQLRLDWRTPIFKLLNNLLKKYKK